MNNVAERSKGECFCAAGECFPFAAALRPPPLSMSPSQQLDLCPDCVHLLHHVLEILVNLPLSLEPEDQFFLGLQLRLQVRQLGCVITTAAAAATTVTVTCAIAISASIATRTAAAAAAAAAAADDDNLFGRRRGGVPCGHLRELERSQLAFQEREFGADVPAAQ
jgi:hypothetical protein